MSWVSYECELLAKHRACGEMMSDNEFNTLAKLTRTFAGLKEAKEIWNTDFDLCFYSGDSVT